MIHKETKFAYRHNPTGKWVKIEIHFDEDLWNSDKYPYLHEMELVDDFLNASIEEDYIIEHDLRVSTLNGEKYAYQNFLEFELVEIEIEYNIKKSLTVTNNSL